MRAREPQVLNSMAPAAEPGMTRHTSTSSPLGFQTSDFPSLEDKSDFPSLGSKSSTAESSSSTSSTTTLLATPWARVVQSSDKAVNNCDQVKVVLPSATSSDIKEDKDKEIEEDVQVQSDDLTPQGDVEVEEKEADKEKHSVIE